MFETIDFRIDCVIITTFSAQCFCFSFAHPLEAKNNPSARNNDRKIGLALQIINKSENYCGASELFHDMTMRVSSILNMLLEILRQSDIADQINGQGTLIKNRIVEKLQQRERIL